MPRAELWLGDLKNNLDLLVEFSRLLNPQELEQVNRMKSQQLRDNAILARGWLRTILASYLDVKPTELNFSRGQYGKPALDKHKLFFNISHTNSTLAIAIADIDNIGIDIEQSKPRTMLTDIAKRCFSTAEFNHWQHLPPDQQSPVFYQLWTKKEAFVKAVGRGIALGMEQCEVNLVTGSGFLSLPKEYGLASDWQIYDFMPANDIYGALVTPNTPLEIKLFALGDQR